jgi:hypothetical protein
VNDAVSVSLCTVAALSIWEQENEKQARLFATERRPTGTIRARALHPTPAELRDNTTDRPPNGTGSPEVVVEALEGVPYERQAHLGTLLHLLRVIPSLRGLEQCGVVRLVDLVGGEVGRVDVGRQARLERRTDPPQAVELNASEEGVVFDLVRTATAKTIFRVANKTGKMVSR